MVKHIHGISGRDEPKKQESSDPAAVKENQEDLKEQAANANQYFRLANDVIKEKIGKFKYFQDGKKRFSDVGILQNKIKSIKDLDKIDPKYITDDDAKDLIAHLENEYEKTQDKLLCQELIVEKTKDEISAKRKEIDEIKEKLNEMLQIKHNAREEIDDPIEALKEELKKAGVVDKNEIYQIINDIAETLNMKNLREQLRKN